MTSRLGTGKPLTFFFTVLAVWWHSLMMTRTSLQGPFVFYPLINTAFTRLRHYSQLCIAIYIASGLRCIFVKCGSAVAGNFSEQKCETNDKGKKFWRSWYWKSYPDFPLDLTEWLPNLSSKHQISPLFFLRLPVLLHVYLLPVCPHCRENPIYVFLFWELRGLSPNFHMYVSVSDLCISRISPHIWLQQNRQTDPVNTLLYLWEIYI